MTLFKQKKAPEQKHTRLPEPKLEPANDDVEATWYQNQCVSLVDETLAQLKNHKEEKKGKVNFKSHARLIPGEPIPVMWSNEIPMCLIAFAESEVGYYDLREDGSLKAQIRAHAEEEFKWRSDGFEVKRGRVLITGYKKICWQFVYVPTGQDPQHMVKRLWLEKGGGRIEDKTSDKEGKA